MEGVRTTCGRCASVRTLYKRPGYANRVCILCLHDLDGAMAVAFVLNKSTDDLIHAAVTHYLDSQIRRGTL